MPSSVSPWLCGASLLLIGAASGPTVAQARVGAGDRSYRLYISSSYRSDRPAPLFLVFHGAGGRGLGIAREDAEVVLYTIEGGGHTWPGGRAAGPRVGRVTREIDATRLIWEFFERHPGS